MIAYNPGCTQNPYSNRVTGTSCLAMLYDTDGFKNPNTSGKDIRSINVSQLGSNCAFEIGGSCFGAPFKPSPLSRSECMNEKDRLGIQNCSLEDYDYWAGAVSECGGVNKMPSMNQLADIANYIYNTSGIGGQETRGDINIDNEKMAELGFTMYEGVMFLVWSREEVDRDDLDYTMLGPGRYIRIFEHLGTATGYVQGSTGADIVYAVCLSD